MNGVILRKVRNAVRYSQAQMAKVVHTTQTTYSRWESGDYPIPAFAFENLVTRLGLNPEFLFDPDKPMFLWEYRADYPVPPELSHLRKSRVSDSDNQIICVPVTNHDEKIKDSVDSVPVHKKFILPFDLDTLKAFRVEDGQIDGLSEGDYVIYVTDYIRGNGIYYVEYAYDKGLRRLFFKLEGSVEARLDARDAPVEHIVLNANKSVNIVGKVIAWVHREA